MADLVTTRLAEAHDHHRALADVFMTWYTFFWTLNAAALAWIFAKTRSGDHSQSVQKRIALLFVILNVSGTATCLVVLHAFASLREEILELTRAAVALKAPNETVPASLFAPPLTRLFIWYGLITCAGTTMLMALVWLFLGRVPSHPDRQSRPSR